MLYECDTAADCPVIRCNAHAPHEKNGLCDQRNNCGAVQALVRCNPILRHHDWEAERVYREMSGDNVAEPVLEQTIRAIVLEGTEPYNHALGYAAEERIADRATERIMAYLHSIDLV